MEEYRMQVTNDTLDRFYNKLDSIDNELKGLTRSLAVTIERQNSSTVTIDRLSNRVRQLELDNSTCPARLSYNSFGHVVGKLTMASTLLISLITCYFLFVRGV